MEGLEEWFSTHGRAAFLMGATICLAVLVFRRLDAFVDPQFYAEDGKYFFADAYNMGWSSLTGRANGYFHLYPRLWANLALWMQLPLVLIPAFFMLGNVAMYVVLWAYVHTRLPASALGRFCAMLATVLVPMGNEIWMNMTNVQWPMALLIPLILFGKPPAVRWRWILDLLVLLLCCFTGPNVLVLLPALIAYKWTQRKMPSGSMTRAQWAVVIGGAVLSAWSLYSYGDMQRTDGSFNMWDPGFVQAAFRQLWYPVLSVFVLQVPFLVQSAMLLVGIAVVVIMYRTAVRNKRSFALLAVWSAASFFLVTMVLYRGEPGFLSPFDAGIRNFYLPTVFLAWAFYCMPIRPSRKWFAVAAGFLIFWSFQTVVFIGPKQFTDHRWAEYAKQLEEGKGLEVPITPDGWTMKLHPRRDEPVP